MSSWISWVMRYSGNTVTLYRRLRDTFNKINVYHSNTYNLYIVRHFSTKYVSYFYTQTIHLIYIFSDSRYV